jgi:mannitol-1-/sugar-/sorbitol-6-phosphatase
MSPRGKTFTVRAVLFDLDGVLVDSRASTERQWRIWAREHNVNEEDLLKVAHGHRTIETIQHFRSDVDAAAQAEEIERREIHDTEDLVAMLGAKRLLESLPPNRWAIATSGGLALATARLRHAGLPAPRVLISAGEVKRGKPDPESYLAAAAGLGFAARDCIVIEDAPSGIQAAHAAGMQAIAVAATYPIEELRQAEFLVRNVDEIHAELYGEHLTLHCQSDL